MKKVYKLSMIVLSFFLSLIEIASFGQEKRDVNIPYSQADYGVTVINNSHGYEIAPGWWGWYGGSEAVCDTIGGLARYVIANQDTHYGFEYDGISWQFIDKYFPVASYEVRNALKMGKMDIVGGTFGGHLPYIVGTESNLRQMLFGTKAIYESVGTNVNTYNYQEFMIYPQLPYALHGTGIEYSMYQNTLAICGRVFNKFRGKGLWQSNDGATVKALVHDPNLEVTCWDVLNLRSSPFTLSQYFSKLDYSDANIYNPSENEFQFDAGGFAASYGNQAAIYINQSERTLLLAEKFSTLSYLMGGNDFAPQLEAGWKALLGSQNHDITYCGSEIYCAETGCSDYEGGKYLFSTAKKLADNVLKSSLEHLASSVNTTFKENGKSLVAFNPHGNVHNDVVEKEVMLNKGEAKDLIVKYMGIEVPYQLSGVEKYDDGSIKKANVVFWAKDMPTLGYRAYDLVYLNNEIEKATGSVQISKDRIQNKFFDLALTEEGEVLAILDKQLNNKLILGVDTDVETRVVYLPFDRTTAYRFRSTLSLMDHYWPRGYEIIEHGPVRTVMLTKYESPNANISMYQTLYEELDQIDVKIVYKSKHHSGDLMDISPGDQREKLFMDFILPENGDVRCNTVADYLEDRRDYYFSNSWVDFQGYEGDKFMIMHEGLHSWHKTFASEVTRNKRERVLACELAITVNEYIPGMLRFNQRSSDEGEVTHRFSIVSGNDISVQKNEKRVQSFYFPLIAVEQSKHKGDFKEKFFLETGDDLILQAFYHDVASGKEPVMRLWNPSKKEVNTFVKTNFGATQIQEIRLDGIAEKESISINNSVTMFPVSLKTIKFNDAKPIKPFSKPGLKFATIAYKQKGGTYCFDAPMQVYRYNHNNAIFEDKEGLEYSITDPFEDIPINFDQPEIKDNYKYYKTKVYISKNFEGRSIRVLHSWGLTTQHGIITCGLTDDYKNRADEPVTIFVNGKEVLTFDGNISNYVSCGEENEIMLKVLYEKVPEEIINSRRSNLEYQVVELGGFFENMTSAFLRVGKNISLENITNEYDCILSNSDFSDGLSKWNVTGTVKDQFGENGQGSNRLVVISNGEVSQNITIKPGNYYFTVDTKIETGAYILSVRLPDGKTYETTIDENAKWQNNRVKFIVPEDVNNATISIRSESGRILLDDVHVFANKVAKEFI